MTHLRIGVEASAAAAGGGLSYLTAQLPALSRQGVDLVVFARPSVVAVLEPTLPEAVFVPVKAESLGVRVAYVQLRLERQARSRGVDVLYCPGSTAPILGRLPVVLCMQNPHLFTRPAPRMAGLASRRLVAWLSALRASEIVHISATMADQFDATAAVDVPVSIIHSGAGNLMPRPRAGPPGRPFILAVSNIYRYKRMDMVVSAYASDLALHGEYDLVIAGGEMEPGAVDGLRQLARAAGLEDCRVRFPGFVAGDHLARLYAEASLYVSASQREAFPLTPAEALVASLPVVLSDIPVFRELYSAWATFASSCDASLAAAMVAALFEGAKPGQEAEVMERFSWDVNAKTLVDVLQRSSGRTRPGLRTSLARVRPRQLGRLFRTVIGDTELGMSYG